MHVQYARKENKQLAVYVYGRRIPCMDAEPCMAVYEKDERRFELLPTALLLAAVPTALLSVPTLALASVAAIVAILEPHLRRTRKDGGGPHGRMQNRGGRCREERHGDPRKHSGGEHDTRTEPKARS